MTLHMLTLFLNTSIASQYIWLQIVARQWTYMGQCGSQEQLQNEEAERAAVAKRQQQAAEAEDAMRKQAEEAYRQAEDAETILLAFNGPDGGFTLEVRLNGTVLELKEKVLAELGMPSGSSFWLECAPWAQQRAHSRFKKEIVHLLEFEFSGYTLQPDEKTVREFDELCPVRCC